MTLFYNLELNSSPSTRSMSVLAIRCPTCGSAAASTMTPNEYECSHCRSKFQIVRPADATVITDSKIHHCPICGRALQPLQSFKCTECGREDFCEDCGTSIPTYGTKRFVCRACVAQKGWACQACGSYAMMVCVSCGRRSCNEHIVTIFGFVKKGDVKVRYFNCQTCLGQLCSACIQEKSGILSTKYLCRKCGNEVPWSTETGRLCKFCGHTVVTGSFCSSCGKALT
jgi:DNA-directed RNA polymerase subunit RPC12/RpoP